MSQGRLFDVERSKGYVWDVDSLSWVPAQQASGGSGGGGAVTIADGADAVEGATTDTAVTSDASGTLSAKLRGLIKIFASVWDSTHGRLFVDGSAVTQPISGTVSVSNLPSTQPVSGTITANAGTGPASAWKVDGSAVTQPISGTITANAGTGPVSAWKVDGSAVTQPVSGTITANAGTGPASAWKVDGSAVTQPVSGTVTANVGTTNGLALDATLTAGSQQTKLTDGTNVASVKAASTAAAATDKALVIAVSPNNSVAVTGTFFQSTQPVSAASLPLPSGAATSAKQPALGTAGTASTDVLTVQGISAMTPLKVDGSGVTQPVSGTFYQATQPISGTVTVQQSTASNLKVDLSGTSANATALKVDGSAVTQPVSGTFYQATQPVSGTVAATQSGTWTVNDTPPSLTKGTQGSTGFTVQDLHDAGRVPVTLYLDAISGITTEALATMNINKGGAVTTGTSYTVTSGKTLRIMTVSHDCVVPSTTGCASRLRLRSAATVVATSPIFLHSAVGTSATAFAGFSEDIAIPDGLEFAGGVQVGLSHVESSAIAGSTTTGAGIHACVIGFEY